MASDKEKVNIVIDTSSLRQVTPTSGHSKRLVALASEHLIQVHLPELVERELATGLADTLRDASPKKWTRLLQWSEPMGLPEMHQAHDFLSRLEESRKARAARAVQTWLDSFGVVRLKATHKDYESAFEAYFDGGPACKRKSRGDIPDAVIFAVIRSLAKSSVPNLHVVAADERLAAACESLPRATVHRTFKSLFEHSDLVRVHGLLNLA